MNYIHNIEKIAHCCFWLKVKNHEDTFALSEKCGLNSLSSASNLYRVQMQANKLVEEEVLVPNLARIRDIDVDADGLAYLLVEHASVEELCA